MGGCCQQPKGEELTNINYDNDIFYQQNEEEKNYSMNRFNSNQTFGPNEGVVRFKVGNNNANSSSNSIDRPRFNQVFQDETENRSNDVYNNINDNVYRNYDSLNHNGAKLSTFNPNNNYSRQIQQNREFNRQLSLVVKESKVQLIGQTINITPSGMIGSQRNGNDGFYFFGLRNNEEINDFNFKNEDGISKRHFVIKLEREYNPGYLIKNLNGSGTFIKIDKYLPLKDGTIISFGTNHLIVMISDSFVRDQRDSMEKISNIKFKVIYGPNKGEE